MTCVRGKEMQIPPLVQPPLPWEGPVSEAEAPDVSVPAPELLNNEGLHQGNKEEEEVALDTDHRLVLNHQTALTQELCKVLERMRLKLNEKRKTEKEDASYSQELSCKLDREQAYQLKLQEKLQNLNTAQGQTVANHRRVEEQLAENAKKSSAHSEEKNKAECRVAQLQAELDNLMLLTVYTQEGCDDMHLQVCATKLVQRSIGVENRQVEEEKRKQDLYVDLLTKELDGLTQQKSKHLGEIIHLKEETQEANKSLLKVNMDMEFFLMTRKQLLCRCNDRLQEMQKRDEPLSAKLQAVFEDRHRLMALDDEIKQYKKSIKAQEEEGQALINELKWHETDCAALKKRISERQSRQDCLQSRYAEKKSILRETSQTVAALKEDVAAQQDELNKDLILMVKLRSNHLEFENEVLARIQQLPHKDAAQLSLLEKMASLMKAKRNQLQLQESNTNAMKLARHDANVMVHTLELTEKDLEEEIRRLNKQLTVIRTEILSSNKINKQKQETLTEYKTKVNKFVNSMANEDLGPLEEKVKTITAEMEELETTLSHDKLMWKELQENAIKTVLDIEADCRKISTLQTENTALLHKARRLDSQVEFEHQVDIEMEITGRKLCQVQVQLNALLGKHKMSDKELEQETTLMETELNHKLQGAYWESVSLQMKYENIHEENEQIMASLVKVEQHTMFWERKAQVVEETLAAVNCEANKETISTLKVETHRREVHLSGLMRRQEELVNESQKVVERWSSNLDRQELKSEIWNKKQAKKITTPLTAMSLRRGIKDAQKLVVDFAKKIVDEQGNRTSLSNHLMLQQQQMTQLCNARFTLDSDIVKLQDLDPHRLQTLVTREKNLKKVVRKRYKLSTSSEGIEAALKKVMEHLLKVGTISSRVCKEFPQHREALHRLTLELAYHTQQ